MSGRYQELLRRLYAFEERGMRLGLEGIRRALASRDHPERAFPSIIIGGSNGKGTSVALIERALRESGVRTGLFTSPHLHRFLERIRIDGEPLDEESASSLIEAIVNDTTLGELSFFEAVTLMAFEAFRAAAIDIAILEVGLGGRLDTTNVVEPLFSGVTNISLEHTAILGDTIEAIAAEKAGIFREGRPALIGDRGEGKVALTKLARSIGALPVYPEREAPPTSFLGPHERDNARFAFSAIELLRERGFDLPKEAVTRGFSEARWPGRFELIQGAPEFLFDAGHNPAACEALAAALRALPPSKETVLIFGAMKDKDHRAMLASFDGVATKRIYLKPPVARAEDPSVFAAFREGEIAQSAEEAFQRALELTGPDDLIDARQSGRVVACGSIFVMAEIRKLALGVQADPPIAM